jgi:hypothetical protein
MGPTFVCFFVPTFKVFKVNNFPVSDAHTAMRLVFTRVQGFFERQVVSCILDRDWNPKVKIRDAFFANIFSLCIAYFVFFSCKKMQKVPIRVQFFSRNRSIRMSKYPEFYADFKSDVLFKEKKH